MYIFRLSLVYLLVFTPFQSWCLPDSDYQPNMPTAIQSTQLPSNSIPNIGEESKGKEIDPLMLIPFSFTARKLTDIIAQLQELKKINIILPQGANAIKPEQTITFAPPIGDSVTVQAAWELLQTFLDLSGYSMIQGKNFYTVVKNDERLAKDVLPVYIVPPTKLPYSEERIRYVYYFKNLKLSDEAIKQSIETILKEMLSPLQLVLVEPKSNAIIITDKSDLITSAMRIISELDISGFKETIEVIPLYYAAAIDVKAIFDSLKLAANVKDQPQAPMPFLRGDAKAEASTYFPAGTVVQADPRTNSLIVMGRESAVSRIQEFVEEYIDLPATTGKSILHIVDLQYLDAQSFAITLKNIVERQTPADQSRGMGANAGPERFFGQGIIIKAEPTINSSSTTVTDIRQEARGRGQVIDNARTLEDAVYSGGNRLIIAALNEDWIRLKDLIDKLDKPQKQVIIETFIADISVDKNKVIASDTRNLLDCGTDNWLDYLSVQMGPANSVLTDAAASGTGAGTLAADLLQRLPSNATPLTALQPGFVLPGSLILTFNENCTGIWGIMQILDTIANTNVISRPHIITLNNEVGKISQSIIRRALGQPYASSSGVPVTPFVDIQATILVQVRPRVSSNNRVTLEIAVNISQFVTGADNASEASKNRIERGIRTNANLNSGQVLILGGLTRRIITDNDRGTPILMRIPFIGNLFKRQQKRDENLNLAIFIAPTIVEPKLRGGQNAFTADKLAEGRYDFSDDNTPFNNNRDPITRFFFTDMNEGNLMTEEYLSRSYNAAQVDPTLGITLAPKKKVKVLTRENVNVKRIMRKSDTTGNVIA